MQNYWSRDFFKEETIYEVNNFSFLVVNIKDEIIFLIATNFDFASSYTIGRYFLEKLFFAIFTNPIFIFLFLFAIAMGFFMKFATKNIGKVEKLPGTVFVYFTLFAILFGFWWTVSIIYVLLGKKVVWR